MNGMYFIIHSYFFSYCYIFFIGKNISLIIVRPMIGINLKVASTIDLTVFTAFFHKIRVSQKKDKQLNI